MDNARVARERASRLAEFRDRNDEAKETKDQNAFKQRHAAMLKGSPEDMKRAAEVMAGQAMDEGMHRKDRLRKAGFTGWKRKG